MVSHGGLWRHTDPVGISALALNQLSLEPISSLSKFVSWG